MDSEFSDTKKLYEVKELQDYDTDSNIQFKVDDTASRKQPQSSAWKIPIVLGLLILSVILLLVVILQSITIAHLNLLPVVCPEEEATTPSVTTDALTGTDVNMQLLSQLSQLINMSKDIMSNGNDIKDTSQNILSISTEHYAYSLQNNTNWLNQILETTQGSAQKLYEIVQTLSNIKDNGITTEGVVNDILMIVEELLRINNDSLIFSSHLPISCQDIKNKQPNSTSGYYHINSQLVYCEMDEMCSIEGGWTRIAYLDMTDSTVDCPPGFMLDITGGIRRCGRPTDVSGASCEAVSFPSNGISYSEVCGRVIGNQFGSTEAVFSGNENINSQYVDGVSITQGSPRKHVWTLIAGLYETKYSANYNCPCNTPPGVHDPPPFVGDNYFCESGNPTNGVAGIIYQNDPLWDGDGCSTVESTCCNATSGLPWFYRSLDVTTDYIELRDCGSFHATNENIFISFYEIYVK